MRWRSAVPWLLFAGHAALLPWPPALRGRAVLPAALPARAVWPLRGRDLRGLRARGTELALLEPRVFYVAAQPSGDLAERLALPAEAAARLPCVDTEGLDAALARLDAAGLSRAALAALLQERPAALRRVVAPAGEDLAALVGSLGAALELAPDEVGRLLLAAPARVLDLPLARLECTVAFIESHVGGHECVGQFVQKQPQALLWKSGAGPIVQHLQSLGVSEKAIRVARAAGFDSLSSTTNAAAVLAFVQEALGLSTAQLSTLLAKYPQLLGLRLANVRATVEYVASHGVPAKVFARHPQLFGLSLDKNLRPTCEYLEGLGVDLGRALASNPTVLSLSLEQNIVPTVGYLESVGMRKLGRVLTRMPSILGLTVAGNLQPKVEYLESLGLGDLGDGLGAQLDVSPELLTLSLEQNLRPKVEALHRAGLIPAGREATAGRNGLRPRHLTASLNSRVRPRLAFCDARQRALAAGTVEDVTGPILKKRSIRERLTLNILTTCSDAAFATQVGASAEEYAEFRAAFVISAAAEALAVQTADLVIDWLPKGFDLGEALRDRGREIAWLPGGNELGRCVLAPEMTAQLAAMDVEEVAAAVELDEGDEELLEQRRQEALARGDATWDAEQERAQLKTRKAEQLKQLAADELTSCYPPRPEPKKRGRPKGSLSKKKAEPTPRPEPKKRGRPKAKKKAEPKVVFGAAAAEEEENPFGNSFGNMFIQLPE